MSRRFIPFLIAFLLPVLLAAQPPKAKKLHDEGVTLYLQQDLNGALAKADKVIRIAPEYIEGWLLRADVLRAMKDTAAAIDAYRKSIELNPDYFPGTYYSLAYLLYLTYQFEEAAEHFDTYLGFEKIGPEQQKKARRIRENARFGAEAVEARVDVNLKHLSATVNSQWDDYVNCISLDGTKLYFTRKHPADERTMTNRRMQEDLFYTEYGGVDWTAPEMLPYPLTTPYDEGSMNLSADGAYAFFASRHREGYGRFDLFASRRDGEHWSEVFNLGAPVNSEAWESMPSFSSDGRSLYFISDRKGGQGSSDIYMSKIGIDGKWSTPVNLGPVINTPYKEMTPVIHPDNQTLFFASEGHRGLGGLDFYMSRRMPDGSWGKPVNLGYPVNTVFDDYCLVIHPNGQIAFVSRENPGQGMDIYTLELPPSARAQPVTYLAGTITDKETGKPLDAVFRLVDLGTGDTLIQAVSDPRSGDFMLTLPTNRSYALYAEKEGYHFHSEHFDITGEHPFDEPFHLDIRLQQIEAGAVVVLRNVFFDIDEYVLKPESYIELDKFALLMRQNPGLNAEIGGHTDNTGSAEHNRELSVNRAKAVMDYLVENGIDEGRLSYRGYGMDKPIAGNDTPEGRQLNRRTEIRFLE